MRTITILKAFTWQPTAPQPGKRLPLELREQSFKANRVETVADEVADWAIKNKLATERGAAKPKAIGPVAPPPKPTRAQQQAEAKAKADAAAAERAAAEAAEKAAAEAKSKQGGAGAPDPNPPKLKFQVVKEENGKGWHVVQLVEGQAPLAVTAVPLNKGEAETLLADLEELEPKSLEEAKEMAAAG